jgi:hypothetical protein
MTVKESLPTLYAWWPLQTKRSQNGFSNISIGVMHLPRKLSHGNFLMTNPIEMIRPSVSLPSKK